MDLKFDRPAESMNGEGGTANMLSDVFAHATSMLKYLHRNAWTIVFIIAGAYFCYSEVIAPRQRERRAARSYREATDPDRVAVLAPDLRRVRARQQDLAAERARAAAEEAKKKAAAERERKRVKSPEELRWEKMGGEGNRVGEAVDANAGAEAEAAGGGMRRRR